MLQWLRRFADGGNAVVLITHKLDEALSIADDVTVLRRGRVALYAAASTMTTDGLANAMLGEDLSPTGNTSMDRLVGRVVVTAAGVDVLNARGLVAVRDVNLSIRAGEIVGLAAIEGEGQRELLRALAGRALIAKGELRLPESIGFVPEDRHRDALVLGFTLAENVALKGAGNRRGRLTLVETRERTSTLDEFDVAADGRAQPESVRRQSRSSSLGELDAAPGSLSSKTDARTDIRATGVRDRLRIAAGAKQRWSSTR